MFGIKHERATDGGRDPRWWPLLLLLLAVVLLPTACLLWMMSRAIDNERSAVRQVLADACRGQLVHLQQGWDEHWRTKAARLDQLAEGRSAERSFMYICRCFHAADGTVICDERHQPVYPTASSPLVEQPADPAAWTHANGLELAASKQESKLLATAEAYATLAKDADANLAARATVAQARCLAKAGRRDEAINLLDGMTQRKGFDKAVDGAGRLIVPDALLRALELIGDRSSFQFQGIADSLARRLDSYGHSLLGSPQRLFLMQRLMQLRGPKVNQLYTLPAEQLAAEFLASATPLRSTGGTPTLRLQPSGVPAVWQFPSASGHTVALFREKTIDEELQELVAEEKLPAGVRVELLPSDRTADLAEFLYVLPAGDRMPGWQLGLAWNDEQLVNATAHGKIAAYMLTGLLAVAIAAGLALWIALRFLRQMRLTRLKNDLVATVSHELKTPLASIRLLVDTLLAADGPRGTEEVVAAKSANSGSVPPTTSSVPVRTREYLELIAKENARLSRLIDNFLTFSRMERNKRAFSLAAVEPAAIVASAADAVRERFEQSGCRFDVQVEPNLPPVTADADAMTTALVNLLDNAWKYSEADKQIALRAFGEDGRVAFAVSDNGIGLSRAACKRVFERFYQVDRELSRSRGGCGLGLSIVEFIVKGHGGNVTVRSRPGQGSTFTIVLPRAEEA